MELTLPVKSCLNCESDFEFMDERKKYCSLWCVKEAYNARRKSRPKHFIIDHANWNKSSRDQQAYFAAKYQRTGTTALASS